MPRPSTTLILITGDRWIQADLDGNAAVSIKQGESIDATFDQQIDAAMMISGKVGKRVWVMSDRLWLGEVDMPPGATVGLSDAELSEAAGYEAEAAGGLPALESITSAKRMRTDGDERFLATQAPREELIAIAAMVKKRGGTFEGLLHPAGLPEPLNLDANTGQATAEYQTPRPKRWSRVEFWPDGVVVVNMSHDRCEVHPTGMLPTVEWRRTVKSLIAVTDADDPSAGVEYLVGPGVKPRGGAMLEPTQGSPRARWSVEQGDSKEPVTSALDLSSDTALERFATCWVQRLAAEEPTVAVIRKPKLPTGPWAQIAVGVAAALIVGLVVGLQYVQNQSTIAELESITGHTNKDMQAISALKDEVRKLEIEQQRVKKEQQKLANELAREKKARQQRLASQPRAIDMRPRIAALLDALADASDDHQVVHTLTAQSPSHRIEGVATSPAAAVGFNQRISEALSKHWIVYPAKLTPVAGFDTVAWQFSILVEPVGLHRAQPKAARVNRRMTRDK